MQYCALATLLYGDLVINIGDEKIPILFITYFTAKWTTCVFLPFKIVKLVRFHPSIITKILRG